MGKKKIPDINLASFLGLNGGNCRSITQAFRFPFVLSSKNVPLLYVQKTLSPQSVVCIYNKWQHLYLFMDRVMGDVSEKANPSSEQIRSGRIRANLVLVKEVISYPDVGLDTHILDIIQVLEYKNLSDGRMIAKLIAFSWRVYSLSLHTYHKITQAQNYLEPGLETLKERGIEWLVALEEFGVSDRIDIDDELKIITYFMAYPKINH